MSDSDPIRPAPIWEDFQPKALDWDAPPEYAVGAWPADAEEALAGFVESRAAMGLDSSKELVVKLATTPGAITAVQEFGFPVTAAESAALRRAFDVQEVLNELGSALWHTPGYAGAVVEWGGDLGMDLTSLEIRSTNPKEVLNGSKALEVLERSGLRDLVKVKQVDSSWVDLIAYSDSLSRQDAVRFNAETLQVTESERNAARSRVSESDFADRFLAELPVDVKTEVVTGKAPVGYSLSNNWITVGTSNAKAVGIYKGTVETESGVASINVVDVKTMIVEPESLCENRGCSATRAGVRIEFSGSNNSYCTLGLPVTRNSDESFLTAGHCGWRSFDAKMQTNGLWTRNRTLDQGIGSTGTLVLGPIDLQRIATPDRRVTNRLRGSQGNGQRISDAQWPTNSMINLQVCKSGARTGITCGKVTEIGDSGTYPDGTVVNGIIRADYSSNTGDSGGPVYQRYNNSIVVGTHIVTGGFHGVNTIPALQNDLWVYTTTNRPKDFVLGLYEDALSRFPDNGGFDWHLTNVDNGCNANNLVNQRGSAYAFYVSNEFFNKFPLATQSQRRIAVKAAYQGILKREPSWQEADNWATITANGNWPTVVWSLAASTEFSNRFWGGGGTYDGKTCG